MREPQAHVAPATHHAGTGQCTGCRHASRGPGSIIAANALHACPAVIASLGSKYPARLAGVMHWTATQRFVFLGLRLAHQGDDEVQQEEQAVVTDAARRMAASAGVAEADVDEWIREAVATYLDARQGGMVDQLVQDSIEALGDLSPEVRRLLLQELRKVAMAYEGVNRAEHVWLDDLREAWGVDILAP